MTVNATLALPARQALTELAIVSEPRTHNAKTALLVPLGRSKSLLALKARIVSALPARLPARTEPTKPKNALLLEEIANARLALSARMAITFWRLARHHQTRAALLVPLLAQKVASKMLRVPQPERRTATAHPAHLAPTVRPKRLLLVLRHRTELARIAALAHRTSTKPLTARTDKILNALPARNVLLGRS